MFLFFSSLSLSLPCPLPPFILAVLSLSSLPPSIHPLSLLSPHSPRFPPSVSFSVFQVTESQQQLSVKSKSSLCNLPYFSTMLSSLPYVRKHTRLILATLPSSSSSSSSSFSLALLSFWVLTPVFFFFFPNDTHTHEHEHAGKWSVGRVCCSLPLMQPNDTHTLQAHTQRHTPALMLARSVCLTHTQIARRTRRPQVQVLSRQPPLCSALMSAPRWRLTSSSGCQVTHAHMTHFVFICSHFICDTADLSGDAINQWLSLLKHDVN